MVIPMIQMERLDFYFDVSFQWIQWVYTIHEDGVEYYSANWPDGTLVCTHPNYVL